MKKFYLQVEQVGSNILRELSKSYQIYNLVGNSKNKMFIIFILVISRN